MDFGEALKLLKQGRKVRRDSWPDGQYIEQAAIPGHAPFLATQPLGPDELPWMFTPSSQHVLMEDWEEYVPNN